ncbi:uncharacterized protein G2W53_038412 [Senna tora]|uniref:Uncharacterized protein n=1 Tax=Senna tora TaxID=362788 RepID=A0A834SMI3_9FABA|nr:uncharacterized protein G2W53_038412 [Senna tora]
MMISSTNLYGSERPKKKPLWIQLTNEATTATEERLQKPWRIATLASSCASERQSESSVTELLSIQTILRG